MKIGPVVGIETALRALRDSLIFRPLSRSRRIRRFIRPDFDVAIRFLDDHKIAFDPNDAVIGHDLQKLGHWQRDDYRGVVKLLKERGRLADDRIFVDVGANIGTQTVYALIENDFGRAISIEPMPANVFILRTNVAINDLADKVVVVPKAVAAVSGSLPLSIDHENSGAHSFHAVISKNRTRSIDIEVTTLDEVLDVLDIDRSDIGLVWIDAEGFELEAVKGADSVVASCIPLFIELQSHLHSPDEVSRFLERLRETGYRTAVAMNFKGDGRREFAVKSLDPGDLWGDFLFF